jgi:hypothetical protein
LTKLLAGDRNAKSLLAYDPFGPTASPKWIKVERYEYHYVNPATAAAATTAWERSRTEIYYEPFSLASDFLHLYLRALNWPIPKVETIDRPFKE